MATQDDGRGDQSMANICTQVVVIACKDNESAVELIGTMAQNAERPLEPVPHDYKTAFKMLDGMLTRDRRNRLTLFAKEADTRSEGAFSYVTEYDGHPVIHIDMALKWSPSNQPDEFCEGLDERRYGWVIATGGEWCEYEDITVDDEFMAPEDYDRLCEEEATKRPSDISDLHDLARHHLLSNYTSSEF